MDNLIGKRLDGRYLIESVIGVGGMANVYKGQDVKTGTTVAVKVLKEEFLDNEELVRRFKNESKAISILDHPNIVKVYDVSVTDRLQYIVMEYIDGITLKEYLKQRGGPLTWKEVVYFATQVLSALSHAHSKGIVHRDVKPQNIMLLADGSIKMMDFGIARFSRAQNQTVSDKAIGSVHYISPEQAKGDHTDARTDIYSVGVMLYEMLSGRLPFDGNGAVSIAIKQISDKPTPLAEVAPNVPEGLRQITERAMEKDPKDRYQSAQEMLAAIDEFKKNPSIRFEYEYLTQDSPNKTINKVVNNSKMSSSSNIRTGSAKRSNGSAPKPGNSKIKKKKKSGRFSVLPVFAGMAVAFAIGAFVLVYLIFANSANPLFSSREDVTLINFVNMTQQEFLNSEYNSKLHPIWVSEYNNKYDEGVIFQQNPQPGRTVKEGQRVTLKVSMGTQWVSVPETQSMTKADAVQSIKDAGLVPVTKSVADDSVAAGTVIRTEPAAGESVAGGATVKVYVSRAKVDTSTQVPSLTGKTIEAARQDAGQANLALIEKEQPDAATPGTVLSQSPEAGTTVRFNTSVTVYVAVPLPEPEPEPEPAGEGGIQESWWSSSDGSHQIHQLTDGSMWNENGVRCDAEGNPI